MPYYHMPDQEKLYVREFGQGQPILILSGLGMQSWQWLPFIYHLRHQYKFYIPDWRGFGKSSNCKIPNMDAISSHWADISCLVDQLQLHQFKLIAYSMGATTAMHGMSYGNFAEKISHYLHIDQSPKIKTDDLWAYGLFGEKHQNFKALLLELSTFLAEHPEQFLQNYNSTQRDALFKLWTKLVKFQSEDIFSSTLLKLSKKHSFLQTLVLPTQRLDYLKWYLDNYLYHDEDYRPAITQLNCPVTWISGEKSLLYPIAGQRDINQQIKNSNHIIFHKSGHAPLLQEPIKFRKVLTKFIKN